MMIFSLLYVFIILSVFKFNQAQDMTVDVANDELNGTYWLYFTPSECNSVYSYSQELQLSFTDICYGPSLAVSARITDFSNPSNYITVTYWYSETAGLRINSECPSTHNDQYKCNNNAYIVCVNQSLYMGLQDGTTGFKVSIDVHCGSYNISCLYENNYIVSKIDIKCQDVGKSDTCLKTSNNEYTFKELYDGNGDYVLYNGYPTYRSTAYYYDSLWSDTNGKWYISKEVDIGNTDNSKARWKCDSSANRPWFCSKWCLSRYSQNGWDCTGALSHFEKDQCPTPSPITHRPTHRPTHQPSIGPMEDFTTTTTNSNDKKRNLIQNLSCWIPIFLSFYA